MVVKLEVWEEVAYERAALARVDDNVLRALIGVDEREDAGILIHNLDEVRRVVIVIFAEWSVVTSYHATVVVHERTLLLHASLKGTCPAVLRLVEIKIACISTRGVDNAICVVDKALGIIGRLRGRVVPCPRIAVSRDSERPG